VSDELGPGEGLRGMFCVRLHLNSLSGGLPDDRRCFFLDHATGSQNIGRTSSEDESNRLWSPFVREIDAIVNDDRVR
jgi:hypothetical protein